MQDNELMPDFNYDGNENLPRVKELKKVAIEIDRSNLINLQV